MQMKGPAHAIRKAGRLPFRYAAKPTAKKPRIIIAQVDGSGVAVMWPVIGAVADAPLGEFNEKLSTTNVATPPSNVNVLLEGAHVMVTPPEFVPLTLPSSVPVKVSGFPTPAGAVKDT